MTAFFSIFLGTFVLEDVALAFALGLVADGKLPICSAFLACFLGIVAGDLALYCIGFSAGKCGLESRFRSIKKARAFLVNENRSDLLTYSIVISRFIPGTRLPTYLAAGLLRYPLLRFSILTFVTVLGWVALAFAVGQSLRSVLMNHWILTVIAILVFLRIVKFLVPKLSDRWERKALRHSWRRFLSFEFWPSFFFYIPIIPVYVFLAIRHRSFFAPFCANPEIENAGLIGESKWDFLNQLDRNSPHTLRALKLTKQSDFTKTRELLDLEGFTFPFILKPDIGQRGFGVRIIRDDFDLTEYLLLADFDMIVQALSSYPNEAGVFYARHPSMRDGRLFSITDKHFPSVVGDGQLKLGDLILRDPRARIIASTYFARHRQHLNEIPGKGEIIRLSECGNHCQGAIFLNGEDLITPELTAAIQTIAMQIPNFFFGRIDLRFKDVESLMMGKDFEIIEINGAGSETTHIWDAKTGLLEAYRALYDQWNLLFEIGVAVKRDKLAKPNVRLGRFMLECLKVFFRKEPLSISS